MYTMYTVLKLHWKPSEYVSLPHREQLVVKAFINERLKEEKKLNKKHKGG